MTLLAEPSAFLIAQVAPPEWINNMLAAVGEDLGTSVLNLLRAVLILVAGWLIAWGVSNLVKGALKRTKIDNQIANWFVGSDEQIPPPIEDWVSTAIYWLVMLFAVIAALEALELSQVSGPLQSLLDEVTRFLPQVGGAAILLGVAWLLATLVKMLVRKTLKTARIDERFGEQTSASGGDSLSIVDTIANTLYWFIFLLFLPSILSTLQLEGTLTPVQNLLNQVLDVLPDVFAAVLIGCVGWLVAQVVQRVVTNLLAVTGVDQVGAKFGITGTEPKQKLSGILGTVVYILVLIPVAISALQALKIDAISDPAIAMLEQVLAMLPQVATAGAILVFAYVAGSYVSELVTTLLTGLGFNNLPNWLGFDLPQDSESADTDADAAPNTLAQTPSQIVGTVSLIAIILVATLTAVDILAIEALTELVSGIMLIAGRVLLGVIIFAIGLYLANLAFKLLTLSGTRQSTTIGHAARIAIIILVSAMALRQMGIAPDIVNLAFGLLGGAIAVSVAIAFGVGGRDIAAEQIRAWLDDFKRPD